MSRYHDDHDYREQRGHSDKRYERRGSIFGELLSEVPIVGELFDSVSEMVGNSKGLKKFCCCCAPVFLILLIPLAYLLFGLVKGGLSLFNVNASFVDKSREWLNGILPFDQIGQWLDPLQKLIGQ